MRITLRSMAGIAVCTLAAVVLTVLLKDGGTMSLAAPVICIQVVIITALWLGRWPALIGAVIAGLMFKIWLYPPFDSLWIHDPAQRIVLTIFQLTAVAVAVISPRKARSCPPPHAPMISSGQPQMK